MREKEKYRAMRRNRDRANGGLSHKIPRHLLVPVGPGYSNPEKGITSPRKLERLRKSAD